MESETRWQAVLTRNHTHDGRFVYAVRSTGIYCRPSCPSRRPKRDNVEFHDSPAQAQTAGYRPCKRCRPDLPGPGDPTTQAVLAACRAMEASDTMSSLDDLARAAGLSPSHFHRAFKAHLGLTPRAYAQAQRARRVRDHLARDGSITDALYAAGFNAASRFYDQAEAMLGMSPRTYRDGGAQTRIHYAWGQSWLGIVLAARTMRGVCAILLGDNAAALVDDLATRFPKAELIPETEDQQHVLAAVIAAVENPDRGLDLPLDIRGTAFQQRVWQALRDIPAGSTKSYAQVAQSLGQPRASRAVAGACAANPLAVAVPCHRVVRGDGGLSGYRWGIGRKRGLLKREGVSLRRDSDPTDD